MKTKITALALVLTILLGVPMASFAQSAEINEQEALSILSDDLQAQFDGPASIGFVQHLLLYFMLEGYLHPGAAWRIFTSLEKMERAYYQHNYYRFHRAAYDVLDAAEALVEAGKLHPFAAFLLYLYIHYLLIP